ncbi:MAG: hypothetical protein GPOALKHO_000735 [Sodalis sp.]|nr:MAG: hypothetical protein GPOALKHO_000735 [Sodalis sp.]
MSYEENNAAAESVRGFVSYQHTPEKSCNGFASQCTPDCKTV